MNYAKTLCLAVIFLSISLFATAAHAQDSDSDGMPDAYELTYGCLMPFVDDAAVDYDTDGMTSLAEYTYSPDLNPCIADTDGDGMDDGWESNHSCMAPLYDDRTPFLAASYDTPGNSYDVFVAGDYAYVADGTSGLQIYDVSDPGTPSLVGTYVTNAYNVFVSGNYAYLSAGVGLKILNVSNPASPTLIGSYDIPNGLYRIFFSGNYVYVLVGSKGFQIIDVSNPSNPVLAGSFFNLTWGPEVLALDVLNIFVSGGYAYFSWGELRTDDGWHYYYAYYLDIVDISDPSNPSLTARYRPVFNFYDCFVSGNHAYLAAYHGLKVLDVSNPADPILIGDYYTPGSAFGVYVYGNFAFVADNGYGLRIVDVSNPAYPTAAWYFNSPNIRDVFVSGNYAYLANGVSGFQIIVLPDHDGDGLLENDEYSLGTNPCLADTDGDTFNDTIDCGPTDVDIYPAAPELCDSIDNQCPGGSGYGVIDEGCVPPDADSDGLSDGQEIILGTDPNDSDTDDDGVNDGDEYNTLGTDPLSWDSDNDNLPDGFEVANMSGHTTGMDLNPLSSADGNSLDFDSDGIPNTHDYWNAGGGLGTGGAGISGNGVYVLDRVGFVTCGYWGEGDGDGFIAAGDLSVLSSTIKGDPDYAMVYPDNGETQDLDGDGFLAAGDASLLSNIIKGQVIDPFPSRPTGILRVEPASGNTLSGAVGDTVSVVVSVTNEGTATTAGIPIVFSIDAGSSGAAVILGGEGDGGLGTRYDLSTVRASLPEVGGKSRVVLKLTGAGTVIVNATLKQCGAGGVGRYCDEVTLAEPVEVTVTP